MLGPTDLAVIAAVTAAGVAVGPLMLWLDRHGHPPQCGICWGPITDGRWHTFAVDGPLTYRHPDCCPGDCADHDAGAEEDAVS